MHCYVHDCTTENYILKFQTVSSVSSDSIVKGIIDDIIKTAVKTAEVDEPYFLCTVVLSTSEKIAYMYTFKIRFDTSVIQ
jgi:hypothetical protein